MLTRQNRRLVSVGFLEITRMGMVSSSCRISCMMARKMASSPGISPTICTADHSASAFFLFVRMFHSYSFGKMPNVSKQLFFSPKQLTCL